VISPSWGLRSNYESTVELKGGGATEQPLSYPGHNDEEWGKLMYYNVFRFLRQEHVKEKRRNYPPSLKK